MKHRLLVIIGLAALLAGCAPTVETGTAVTAAPDGGGAVVPAVALDGTYRVEYDGTGTKNGAPVTDLRKAAYGWIFRMSCTGTGCVAVGAPIADTDDVTLPLTNVGVADYVDGRWLMPLYVKNGLSCDGPGGEKYTTDGWSIWDITGTDDEVLTPVVSRVSADECSSVVVERPRMLRRGDPIPEFPLPDPADQPPRTIAPAAAFHGDYAVTATPAGRPKQTAVNHEVQTWCEHTGERCVTTATSRSTPEAPFADLWVYQFEGDGYRRADAPGAQSCPDGRPGMTADSEALPLRADTHSDPIRTLTGERTSTFTQGCAGTAVAEVEYALTSD